MIRILLFLFSFCLFSSILCAQSSISIGFRTGINISSSIDKNYGGDYENGYVNGLALAIPLEIGITSKFYIQPELQYIIKGFRVNHSASSYFRFYSKYIEIPVLAKYKFGNKKFKFNLIAGPTIGYLTGLTIESARSDISSKIKVDLFSENEKALYKRLELGAAVGFGAEILAKNGTFLLDLRHNMDFNSYYNQDTLVGPIGKRTNSGYSVSLGYLYTLKN